MPKAKPKPAPGPAPPARTPGPEPAAEDPRFQSVLPFVRGVCALLPNEVPQADQQDLVAIAVRASAHDRDRLLAILRRGCGEE